jgi:predicted nucleic acid-binding protein
MEIVFDSSTLILLAKIELLRTVSDDIQVIIPEMVRRESTGSDIFDAKLIEAAINKKEIKVIKIEKAKIVNKLCKDFKVHKGEAEALALALQRQSPLAVDDLPTIKACKILNHKFTTAIHLLINAYESGTINQKSAFVKLEKLSLYGRYKQRIITDAMRRLQGGD